MIVSILKMNWQKGLPLKTLQHFYVKIQQLYLKKSVLIGFQIGITKVLFITQRTFAFIVTIVKRPMPVEKSFSVALSVSCPTCNQTCKDFEKERCKRLDKAPYVCNGCTKKINHCTIAHKYYYNGRAADRKYRELLISSRSGINMTKHQLHQKDQIISPLIEQGQSPYQILTNHPELDMSVRSMYTYIDKGLFTARNIDLKRQAKFKPRKCHKTLIVLFLHTEPTLTFVH